MLADHVCTLLNQCFHTLMANHAIQDLKLLYSLLKRVNALDEVKKSFNTFIKGAGRVRIKDEEKDKTLVVDLLRFKQWMDRIVHESFESNDSFVYSLKVCVVVVVAVVVGWLVGWFVDVGLCLRVCVCATASERGDSGWMCFFAQSRCERRRTGRKEEGGGDCERAPGCGLDLPYRTHLACL
jgi:Cullin family